MGGTQSEIPSFLKTPAGPPSTGNARTVPEPVFGIFKSVMRFASSLSEERRRQTGSETLAKHRLESEKNVQLRLPLSRSQPVPAL